MTIFLILAPFGSFALLMLVTSAQISLFAAAAICLAVIGVDIYRGRSIKMLGAGCVAVFTGLGAYVTLIDPSLSSCAVKLAALVGTRDRLRRPQQCRLFHDMVSTVSQGEVWCAAGERPARRQLG